MVRRALLLVALVPGLAAASTNVDNLPFTCRAEMAQLEVNMRESEVRFDDAWVANDPAQKCVAIRLHVEVMRTAVEVYTRCLSGPKREKQRDQALSALADTQSMVDELFCQ
jgi:hypothetical protein